MACGMVADHGDGGVAGEVDAPTGQGRTGLVREDLRRMSYEGEPAAMAQGMGKAARDGGMAQGDGRAMEPADGRALAAVVAEPVAASRAGADGKTDETPSAGGQAREESCGTQGTVARGDASHARESW